VKGFKRKQQPSFKEKKMMLLHRQFKSRLKTLGWNMNR